jgi:hypothetical protein
VLKDELWRRIIQWFANRLERRMGGERGPERAMERAPAPSLLPELKAASGP